MCTPNFGPIQLQIWPLGGVSQKHTKAISDVTVMARITKLSHKLDYASVGHNKSSIKLAWAGIEPAPTSCIWHPSPALRNKARYPLS